MNLNLLKHSTHLETGFFLETLLEYSLLPLITVPTRKVHNSVTFLDHTSTNICIDNFDSGIIISDISEHFPFFYKRYSRAKNTQI